MRTYGISITPTTAGKFAVFEDGKHLTSYPTAKAAMSALAARIALKIAGLQGDGSPASREIVGYGVVDKFNRPPTCLNGITLPSPAMAEMRAYELNRGQFKSRNGPRYAPVVRYGDGAFEEIER